ncbi:MAG TPA: hypothetical protein VFT67_02430 [Jatrophihabitantaceae bacterium]|nr:hypothetical protein [Jatrophihabitantaceae bacterium]
MQHTHGNGRRAQHPEDAGRHAALHVSCRLGEFAQRRAEQFTRIADLVALHDSSLSAR